MRYFTRFDRSYSQKFGTNNVIPIEDNYLDFAVSWGASYYMSDEYVDYSDNLSELARILKPDGILILDNLQKNASIYDDAVNVKLNYWKNEDGIVFRRLESIKEIVNELKPYFYDFATAELTWDCFGRNDSRYTIVCRKK